MASAVTSAPEQFGEDIHCPKCSYSLHLAPGDKCPECGYPLANLRSVTHPIPWTQRKERGRFRTYWQTVVLATFRHMRFCEHYAHDVALRDARAFRCVTVLCVFLMLVFASVFAYVTVPIDLEAPDFMTLMASAGTVPAGPTLVMQAISEVWPVAIMLGFLLLFMFAATGAASYFFDRAPVSAQRQISAVALSNFACAPIAFFLPLVLVLWGLISLLLFDRWLARQWQIDRWFGPAVLVAATVSILAYWWNLTQLARRVIPQLKRRRLALVVGLPVLWIGLGVILLGLLPLSVLYILIVIFSFGP